MATRSVYIKIKTDTSQAQRQLTSLNQLTAQASKNYKQMASAVDDAAFKTAQLARAGQGNEMKSARKNMELFQKSVKGLAGASAMVSKFETASKEISQYAKEQEKANKISKTSVAVLGFLAGSLGGAAAAAREYAGPLLFLFKEGGASLDIMKTAAKGLDFVFSGSLLSSLKSAGSSLAAFGTTASASLAPLLPYIAIVLGVAAALTALYLVAEDLWTFLNGGESVTGDLLAWFGLSSDQIAQVRDFMSSTMEMFKALGGVVLDVGKAAFPALRAIGGFLWKWMIKPLLYAIGTILAIKLFFLALPLLIAGAMLTMATYIYRNWDEIKRSFSSGIDSIVDWFLSIPQRIADLVSRLAALGAEMVLALVPVDLLNSIIGSVNKLMGSLSSLSLESDFIKDFNWTPIPLFDGARAAGGPVAAGRSYLVGEQGPELFIPGRSGQIAPNGSPAMQGNGGVHIEVGPVYVNGNSSQEQADDFAAKLRDALDRIAGDLALSSGLNPAR